MGKLFYIMGQSASGKDSIYQHLMENCDFGLKQMILYTTRPIRQGEVDGREYHFVNENKLQELQAAGKIIELRAYNTVDGVWSYFTVDDGSVELDKYNYLGIGTLESYQQLKDYYGETQVQPLYIQVEDGERLERALRREAKQAVPKYAEVKRRFHADARDFSEAKVKAAKIERRFLNHDRESCLAEIENYISSMI